MKVTVEYIWNSSRGICSKTSVVEMLYEPTVDTLPNWKYSEGNAEYVIKPRVFKKNPLSRGTYLVLCDAYNIDGTPISTNTRVAALDAFNNKPENDPWFGLDQEYTMCKPDITMHVQRTITKEHLVACLEAGIKISGFKTSSAPRQWEFQVGPCVGIEASDHLILARFLLEQIAEQYDVHISYEHNGCYTNFSTRTTRELGGIEEIYKCMERLAKTHQDKEQSNKNFVNEHFSVGIGSTNTSIRIPKQTFADKCGYFEDRRPAANMDPYLVTSKLYKNCCL
jgi:glutamine synthetase